MLPLLPAILLLLLQGPANFERLAVEGRLPAAIQAMQQMDAPRSRAETEAFANLLAASKDPQLTQALVALFNWIDEPVEVAKPTIETSDGGAPACWSSPPVAPKDGFTACRRTRDGPACAC